MAEFTVPARLDCLNAVFDFVGGVMQDSEIDLKWQYNINIAVEEIFVNIVSYAYPTGEGSITVCLSVSPDKCTIEFRDNGTPFNPLAKPDPDTTLSVSDREIGGLGIFIVKKLMDTMEYRYEDNNNILVMEKYL
ncbi:MAG: ATP-binding protein [Treponema sp.]|nr:ATP-binding protein [Treponema sp.]